MSVNCEESPAEDPSTIAVQPAASADLLPAEPEPEAPSEVERETSEVVASQEEQQSVSENQSAADISATTTDVTVSPVKRIVIADSDDDVTDDEDSVSRDANMDTRLRDHDYAVSNASHHLEKVALSDEAFPEIPGLSELGYSPDHPGLPPESHVSNRVPASLSSQMGYESREPNIINRSPATTRDTAVYRAADGQAGYLARPARTSAPAPTGYRATADRNVTHPQQQHFLVSGYGGTPVARRVMTTSTVASPSIIHQKRAAPRIVSSPAGHVRPTGSFHQGSDPPPHRVLLLQSSGGPRVAYSPADPSQAALANAPAPLIVPGRGTRPIVRGRGGSAAGRAKKESTSGVSAEETSPTHSPQSASRIPLSAPLLGNRTTPVSPRKQRPTHAPVPETPPLPDNFVDDAESGLQSHPEMASKSSTLPPEVMAAATSLSAQTDTSHPQWANNDISEDDIKAKIEAISREIAQELEQKRMETEAQAKERRRPMSEPSPSSRRRSGNEGIFSGGEEAETGPVSVPRGRGRPKGSGRTRSSLSSSSSASVAATSSTPSHHDISDGSLITARAPDFQPTRSSGRTASRANATHTTGYDGSMAPELPPPLPPISGTQTLRSNYQGGTISSPPHATTPHTPTSSMPYYQQKDANGVSPDEDLANVSTDPSSDEEEANELKQLKAVAREKERKMAEKLKRREERKRAKLSRRLKERNHTKTPTKRGPAAYRKFQMIRRNEYTKRAKQMLALFDTTAGAQSILETSRDLRRGKRMFVAPDVEALLLCDSPSPIFLQERGNHDVSPQSQPTNGVNSGRKSVSSPPKSKTENRGRPKGSGKKEKATEEVSKKKGIPGRKPKRIGIRLRRHSENKNTKSPEGSSKEQSGEGETSDQKEDDVSEEKAPEETKSVPESSPSAENLKEEAPLKDEVNEPAEVEKPQPTTPQTGNQKKSQPSSPKKEEQPTSTKRRSSTGSGRTFKREATELKEVMDYTLPEDRNKPGPGRPSRTSMGSSGKRGRRGSERSVESSAKEKEKKPEPVVEAVAPRESPRGKKKREESKENEVVEASTLVQPPRKRWAAAVKENEAAQRASSPEVTSSSSTTPMGTVDVVAADSVSPSPSSVGGKKLWLRRHAAESISEENSQTTENLSTPEQPLSCAADSTSDITAAPSKVQEQNPILRPLDADIPIPALGVPPDLEVVKKMILEEVRETSFYSNGRFPLEDWFQSCLPPPPAPPPLPVPVDPSSTVVASSSDMSIASSSESGEERMSLADRLAKEFGVGTLNCFGLRELMEFYGKIVFA
ncbi:hypothetical protein ANCCEY_09959 [Ancylostoma ceylanicum]|uniref:Uncharacterized protein n=1 Tax=Ancylostoma ceylanicum TaxID=53326 RepID=A0A0D6LIC5_9BILA|nr:hypothetical protein ANCCEY_09959 [Ancylostoma ceylanicum]